jgi:hypothetical protein
MGKAKDGSECYTRQNKAGGSYITCEGSQNKRAARSKLKKGGEAPPMINQKSNVGKINWDRTDTVRGKARRAGKARRLTTRPPGRIETGSLNPGSVITNFDTSVFVAEAPGVVAMTSTMSPLGQATIDALLGMGADVSRGISAAVADRNRVGFYNIVFRGKIGSTNAFDIQDAYDTAKGSWFHTNEGLSGNLTNAQVDDMKKRYPDIQLSEVELPPPVSQTPSPTGGTLAERSIAALYPWQRIRDAINVINEIKPDDYSRVLSPDVIKTFNQLNNIPENPKKYLIARIQGRKQTGYVGAKNQLINYIDENDRRKYNISVSFEGYDTLDEVLDKMDEYLGVSAEQKKLYKPLSAAQLKRIEGNTAAEGLAFTPDNQFSFRYGFGFVSIVPFAYKKQYVESWRKNEKVKSPQVVFSTNNRSGSALSDINYQKIKK